MVVVAVALNEVLSVDDVIGLYFLFKIFYKTNAQHTFVLAFSISR